MFMFRNDTATMNNQLDVRLFIIWLNSLSDRIIQRLELGLLEQIQTNNTLPELFGFTAK